MSGYRVVLPNELEDAYQIIADHLSISMEQVLTSALQIYIEKLTLEKHSGIVDDQPIRTYMDRAENMYGRNCEIL
ncbi:hypothetical protein EDD70_0474 [Hydrogenoanaerobacterium saccharovorans]|uniref:Uncharacterized protein n=1 Tax=Hydrogenoanaerobacterium saccharovorans TaxID=474960 RepID=A0A1H8AZA8_9FIRM|nr:hypothetical protein [Hydrogenoanaerobacterium saccharovorans]RPF47676.1 hypothetical protein EDD70_0474 [Hydrogenoanaerobacterium saccharovorans]SEM75833.1 hypothetical protein SAMN05216180_1619 [Hydrogenoanaerobacterium saccharovorans]